MRITRTYCDFCHCVIPKDDEQADREYLLPIYDDKMIEIEPRHHLCSECKQKVLKLYEEAKAEWKNP